MLGPRRVSMQRTYIRGMLWNSKDLVIIYGLTLTHEDVSRQGPVCEASPFMILRNPQESRLRRVKI